jgi:hypothetical protein
MITMCSACVANVMKAFGEDDGAVYGDKPEDAFGNAVDTIFLKQKELRKNFSYDILSKEV